MSRFESDVCPILDAAARAVLDAFADFDLAVRRELGHRMHAADHDPVTDQVGFLGCLGLLLASSALLRPESPYPRRVLRLDLTTALRAGTIPALVDQLGDAAPWGAVRNALSYVLAHADEVVDEPLRPPPYNRLEYDL